MGALASCPFPLLKKWKGIVDRNKLAAFIDSILTGWGQIIFSDNSFSGLLLIIAAFLASPRVGLGGLWASFIATCFVFLTGVPKMKVRLGLYVFSPAMTGFIMGLYLFPDGISFYYFLYIGLAGLFASILSMAIGIVLEKWECPALGLPYNLTALVFLSAALKLGFIPEGENLVSSAFAPAPAYDMSFWTGGNLWNSFYAGIGEMVCGGTIVIAVIILVAIAISSRIDLISAIVGVIVSTGTAILLGAPKIPVMIGLYGYCGIFLMLTLAGRAYTLSVKSYIFDILMVVCSTVIATHLNTFFSTLGLPFTSFPFSIVGIIAILAAPILKGFEYNKPLYWGVPENVQETKAFLSKSTI